MVGRTSHPGGEVAFLVVVVIDEKKEREKKVEPG